jgi:SPW repeat
MLLVHPFGPEADTRTETMPRTPSAPADGKERSITATPLARRPDSGGGSSQAVPAGPAGAEYLPPATGRGIAAKAAALGMLTGLWVAVSPLFITLQHGGGNAGTADATAGLVTAGAGAFALASPRGFPGLQFAGLLLGLWVIISPAILGGKSPIATPMYWSNSLAGGVLAMLALAGLAAARPAAR